MNEQPDQAVTDVFPVFFKFRFRRGRIRRSPAVILRFIREKARQFLAEIFFKTLVILFVRFSDKRVGYVGIQNIRIRGAYAKIHVMIFADSRLFFGNAHKALLIVFHIRGKCRFVELARSIFQIPRAERFVFEQLSADKAARPAVFIVDPRVHTRFARLFQASRHARKPFFAEVFVF